jgi:hypothetical protein
MTNIPDFFSKIGHNSLVQNEKHPPSRCGRKSMGGCNLNSPITTYRHQHITSILFPEDSNGASRVVQYAM